jgi:triosephosphate isomerase
MSGRKPIVAGNWKMNNTIADSLALVDAMLPRLQTFASVERVVCPPFTALPAVCARLRDTDILVGAQNLYPEPKGAFTGEISPPMLRALAVDGAILGHSERRQYFGESDRALQLKVPAALAAGLVPILCVGETEQERERGETERRLRHQVQEALHRVQSDTLSEVVIAYEPVWAIGTGNVATPEQAQEAMSFIRALIADRSREQAQETRILYGGSVNADNAGELLALPDVDGALVGGASLDAESFAAIVAAGR